MYYLNEAQQQLLIHQPETGMGYQLVELTTCMAAPGGSAA
jgi:hypothetical protein